MVVVSRKKTTPVAKMDLSRGNIQQPPGNKESPSSMEDLTGFRYLFGAAEVIGMIMVILVCVWTSAFRGGFSTADPSTEFNWHPLLMTIAFVFLYGNSIMIYRSLREMKKQKLKLIHAGIHFTIIICVIFALVAVFDSHNYAKPQPIPNLYSLHSWVGLITVILFCWQWVASFGIYLYPGAPLNLRSKIMSYHVYFGIIMFILCVATSLMGLTEKTIFSVENFTELPSEGALINFIGLFMIAYAVLVVCIVALPIYKRLPRPEDGALLTPTVSPQ